ncbi:MAG: hypothetical protein WCJ14_09515 [Verrucomicrobiota bacterium]
MTAIEMKNDQNNPSKTLLKRMNKLGQEVLKDISDLEGMLK